MTFKQLAVAAGAAAVVLACGSSALAQTAASAPIAQGPAIVGLCVFSPDDALGASAVGKYVEGRLQQLVAQTDAELKGEGSAIQAENNTLETQRSTLDQNALEQRAAALQVRYNAYQRKGELRRRELAATRDKAVSRIYQEMDPLIRQAYQQKGCSVLLNGAAVMIRNPSMDLTPSVVAALNTKITQFAFDREHLEQQASAGAAPPIVQTPAAPARSTTRK